MFLQLQSENEKKQANCGKLNPQISTQEKKTNRNLSQNGVVIPARGFLKVVQQRFALLWGPGAYDVYNCKNGDKMFLKIPFAPLTGDLRFGQGKEIFGPL